MFNQNISAFLLNFEGRKSSAIVDCKLIANWTICEMPQITAARLFILQTLFLLDKNRL